MRKTTHQKDVAQIKLRMYPPKPWVNAFDKGHKFNRLKKNRMFSGDIGLISGMKIVRVES